MLNRKKSTPQPEKRADICLAILLEEIQQAVSWARPSILLAIHQSKNDQAHAILALEDKLERLQLHVTNILPDGRPINFQDPLFLQSDSCESIIFVRGLGSQMQTYDGLNMDRELIVEQRLKLIFWLTEDEMILLSHRAPDFWAFRHRVVEFPTGRTSRKNNLPSGVLLWHFKSPPMDLYMLRQKIVSHEKLLQNIPSQGETVINHAEAMGNLINYYWLAGENQKAAALLNEEIKQVGLLGLSDMSSMLLNIQAINCFDLDEYHEALNSIEQALDLNPNQYLLWSNHGIICRSAGQGRKTLASLKKAIKLNPASFESWGVLGYSYMSLGKYQSALPCFEKALDLNHESDRYYPAVAVCHSQMGNTKEFNEIIQQISHADGDHQYLSICRDGLLGNVPTALGRLKGLVLEEIIPQIFIRRDPNFHFIFGNSAMRNIL